jgi:hypothetical protein
MPSAIVVVDTMDDQADSGAATLLEGMGFIRRFHINELPARAWWGPVPSGVTAQAFSEQITNRLLEQELAVRRVLVVWTESIGLCEGDDIRRRIAEQIAKDASKRMLR